MLNVISSPEIRSRADLGALCDARRLWLAAEIGTDIGVFAKQFLRNWKGLKLLCIDPYEPYDEMPYDRQADMLVAITALNKFHGRVKFIKARSTDAVGLIPDWLKPHFIYIDGCHRYDAVMADLQAWWPVLPESGILAGHDWDKVNEAVKHFFDGREKNIYLTHDSPASWYCYRTEPAQLLCTFSERRMK